MKSKARPLSVAVASRSSPLRTWCSALKATSSAVSAWLDMSGKQSLALGRLVHLIKTCHYSLFLNCFMMKICYK